jgi:hypothetical protein
MTEQHEIEAYNYSVFEGQKDFVGFRTFLQVGAQAPDFPASLLETGKAVTLSDYWWKQAIVVKFGSHT